MTTGNNTNGFLTKEEAICDLVERKKAWGSNLVGWIEERDARFFVCLNFFD